jgi:hypothetical protein
VRDLDLIWEQVVVDAHDPVALGAGPISAVDAARLVAPGTDIGLVVGNRTVGLPHTVEVHFGQ